MMHSFFPPSRLLACFYTASMLLSTTPAPAAPPAEAMSIRVENSRPVVGRVERFPLSLSPGQRALVVWSEGQHERWQIISGRWQPPQRLPRVGSSPEALFSRGGAERSPDGDVGLLTAQLEQLGADVVLRGWQLLSPFDGCVLLDPRPTFRRAAGKSRERMPAATAVLLRDGTILARIPFREGQAAVSWGEVPGLPADIRNGLPAGTYTLKIAAELGPQTITFAVENENTRKELSRRVGEIAGLLDGPDCPLAIQIAAEHLLGHRDREGRPRPYLCDAFDILDRLPEKSGTPYLTRLHAYVLSWLKDPVRRPSTPAGVMPDATGVAEIDAARGVLAAGEWSAALAALDRIKLESGPAGRRKTALVDLYRAVIHAEAGAGGEEKAADYFRRALRELEGGRAEDRFRAHNNFAGFLLRRCQDRLYNHAFQMAAGVPNPLLRTLADWEEACRQYEAALSRAASPTQRAAVEANQARLYALLGDVLRTLGPEPAQRFAEGEQAAGRQSEQLARRILSAPRPLTPTPLPSGERGRGEGADTLVRAAARQTLAHLAFRAGDIRQALREAREAEKEYVAEGSLTGIEGVRRLLGLCHLRLAESASDARQKAQARRQALRVFLLSQSLAELLRRRYPGDQVGLSRSGFLSRRAYVNEQLVELLIAEGRDAEALAYAERAKARALEDLLAAGRVNTTADEPADLPPSLLPLSPEGRGVTGRGLAAWPKDVTALAYFLGDRRCWVFVVGKGGKVRALPLTDARGRPVPSRELVERVCRFLHAIDSQAVKMRARLSSGRGFDHSWQDELHALFKLLVPSAALAEMRQARTVLVVPHHVLHYFPFAALVTQPDTRPPGKFDMVRPRFLLDERFSLCCAPSLTVWGALHRRPARPITEVNALGLVEVPDAVPLPGVARELSNLKAAFGTRVKAIYEEGTASREGARRLFGRGGLLLIATHGLNVPERPLLSHLRLAPRDGDDGRLSAAEVYGCCVRADLVMLSACYSGLADQSPPPGDDLFGLQRAFLHAGARAVLASLWDVYDGTGPQLMGGVFENLARGLPYHVALAESQRAFLRKCRATAGDPWSHPYFWAVFSLTGDAGASRE